MTTDQDDFDTGMAELHDLAEQIHAAITTTDILTICYLRMRLEFDDDPARELLDAWRAGVAA